MNLGSMRKTMIKSAKAQLDRHKSLGRQSNLSVLQVAELLDILSGQAEPNTINSNIFFDNTFSLN